MGKHEAGKHRVDANLARREAELARKAEADRKARQDAARAKQARQDEINRQRRTLDTQAKHMKYGK